MSTEDRITLKLSPQQLDYIAGVLGQRPYIEVRTLLDDLQQQVALHNFERTQPATANGSAEATVTQ